VRHVLRSVLAELDITLALAGFADLAALRAAPDAVTALS
jgi:isopentenyl diphosphate isomerase/L-lactate dehydrogenase-like FMN-dependent dehydrogenase